MWNAYMEEVEDKPAYRGRSLMGFIIGMSIPAVCIWLWTRLSTGPGCETFTNKPVLIFGILLFFFSVCGIWACISPLATACCWLEHIAFFLLCAFLGYGVFILAVSSPGGGISPPGVGYQDYVLNDYSHWLQKRVNNTLHWDHLKRCLVKKNVCHRFLDEYVNDTQPQFFARHLSSIESGCCKPPTNCNFNYTSAIKWTKSKDWNQTNMDCKRWNEDPSIRCFNCQSCKAGFANDVKDGWVVLGIVILVVFCLILYVSPCVSCRGGYYTIWVLKFSLTQTFKTVGRIFQEVGEREATTGPRPRPSVEITDNNVQELEAQEEATRPSLSQQITDDGNNVEELGELEEITSPLRSREITDSSIKSLV